MLSLDGGELGASVRLPSHILRVAACIILAVSPVYGQGAIRQSGPVVSFHAPAWYANGVVTDGGYPASPFLSAIGLFGGATCPLGISSQSTPGPTTAPYSLFTICQTAANTILTLQGVNGQATPSLELNIGGVIYPFPGPGNGNVLGPISSVSGDVACFNGVTGTLLADCGPSQNAFREVASGTTDTALVTDSTIAWKSASTSAKTETLYACTSGRKGFSIDVKDEVGTAGLYPITVAPNGIDTIDNAALYIEAFNLQNARYKCNGSGNWIVQ